MKDYLFVFGRDPELSLLEVLSYFKARNIENKVKRYDNYGMIVSLNNLDFNKIISDLGGTVKIGEVIYHGNKDEFEYELNKINIYTGKSNKIKYSIGICGKTIFDRGLIEEYFKRRFKEEGLKLIYKKSLSLIPSKIIRSELIEYGLDILLYDNYIAKTIAIYNPLNYKERDLGKPEKDFLKSISIRLAKILINISQVKENQTLLDPFCGTGIILQEALIIGINVIGIDKEEKSVSMTKKNLEWLIKKYNIKNSYKLTKGDAQILSKFVNKVDVIVTEPYLGPYIRKLPDNKEANKILEELYLLYSRFLIESKKILKNEGKIVIIFPRFRTISNKVFGLDKERLINKNGFKVSEDFSVELPIVYSYKESRILREIYVIEKA